nr:hypothetical protein [Acidihalobacter yilgarnensis]
MDFQTLYRGRTVGILRWPQLDAFWSHLKPRAGEGWYVYAVGEPPPQVPADADAVVRFIDEIDALLRREHDHDYCGIVYADDLDVPRLIKIFDPNHLGSSCGSSVHPPPPGWVLSLVPPVDLADAMPLANNRRRWWQRLFGA